MLVDADAGMVRHAANQGRREQKAGRPAAAVYDAPAGVSRLQAEVGMLGSAVEGDAQGQEFAHARLPVPDERQHRRAVVQARAYPQGIGQVACRAVVGPQRGGDPALRPGA